MRRFAELAAKFLNQAGLADAWLADDQDELTIACKSAFQAASKDAEILLAADKWREKPGSFPAPSAADADDAIERDWRWSALEFMRAFVLNDEQPSDLPLDSRGDQHCSRLGRSLNSRGNVGRLPEHLAGGVDHDRTAFEADTNDKLRSASRRVSAASSVI